MQTKVCFLLYRGPLICAWCGIWQRCRDVCLLLVSSWSSRQSREREKACHSLWSFFKRCWVWWQPDGSCIQHDNFWPAAHAGLRTTGFSPRKMVFNISHDQGYAAMLTCLRHVEETVVPVSRSCVGGSVSLHNANDGCLPHVLGSGHEWPLRPRSVGRSPSQVAYQLPGDSGSI